jgi:hypothetical protein
VSVQSYVVDNMELLKRFESEVAKELPNLRYEITEDFIGVFDGLFTPEYCRMWREHFDKLYASGVSYSRRQHVQIPAEPTKIEDEAIDASYGTFYTDDEWKFACPTFNKMFWGIAHQLYADKFSILKNSGAYKAYTIKTQLTRPGGGYHVWHYESMNRENCQRNLVFILYLNTIEEGGETEFLYQKKRIQPVEGRLVIWPAGFTHTHRGNPPLKENKYIVTGWLEF